MGVHGLWAQLAGRCCCAPCGEAEPLLMLVQPQLGGRAFSCAPGRQLKARNRRRRLRASGGLWLVTETQWGCRPAVKQVVVVTIHPSCVCNVSCPHQQLNFLSSITPLSTRDRTCCPLPQVPRPAAAAAAAARIAACPEEPPAIPSLQRVPPGRPVKTRRWQEGDKKVRAGARIKRL